jgi:hypothetical protein
LRVLCCYAYGRLHPETVRALGKYAPQAELVDVSGDQANYWNEIRDRWDGTEDLVIIEQDNEITAGTLPSFEACDQDWCTFAYGGIYGQLQGSLGCTRFSAAFQRRFPHETIAGDGLVWHLIDLRMGKLFCDLHKLKPHIHGTVTHHHDYVRDPLQQRNVINNGDGTFTVTERQSDGSVKVWENCVPDRTSSQSRAGSHPT